MISPKPFFVRMIIPSSYVVVIVTDAKVVSVIIYSLNNVLRFTYVSHTHTGLLTTFQTKHGLASCTFEAEGCLLQNVYPMWAPGPNAP